MKMGGEVRSMSMSILLWRAFLDGKVLGSEVSIILVKTESIFKIVCKLE